MPSLPCLLYPSLGLDANLEALGNSGDTSGKSLDPRITCRRELFTDNHLPRTLPEGEVKFYFVRATDNFGVYYCHPIHPY